jgi:HAE1 family hydrophobic/amphiphilic exporter-1
MVFVSGIAGQLFRDQALTVTYALLFSLLVALTLIPMLAAMRSGHRFADVDDARPPARFTRIAASVVRFFGLVFRGISFVMRILLWIPTWLVQRFYGLLARVYPGLLGWSLRHRWLVLLIALAAFAGSLSLVPRLGSELIPQLAQGEFAVKIRLASGAPLDATDRALARVQEAAASLNNLDLTFSVAGTGNRLDASPVDAGENTGELNVRLAAGATRDDEDQAMAAMRRALQGLAGVSYEFSRPALFSFSTPLEVEISGYDLDQLAAVAASMERQLSESPRFADVKSTVEDGNPEIQILFDHERAARLGLVVRDVADVVVSKVRGQVATRYTWRDKKIDVLVRSVDTRKSSVTEIEELIINPQSARPIPLRAVADVRITTGPAEIRRHDQERVAVISANLNYGDLSTAVTEAGAILQATPLPQGITALIAGQSEEMSDSFRSMLFTLAMAVFLVYLVMASQFESLLHPFVILFTIPLALVGAILALFVTGTTINVVVFIGLIMLAGIVVNNAIVLVDLVNQLRAEGIDRTEALMEAGRARLRPILMTTLTTTLGLLPMVFGIFGEGSEVRAPMAITVIGGLLVSTFLTLVVIPVVYSLIDRKQWSTAGAAALPPVSEART